MFTGSVSVNVYDIDTTLADELATQLKGQAAALKVAELADTELKKVSAAVLRTVGGLEPPKAKRCEWLTARGGFKTVKPNEQGVCDEPVWIKAKLGKTKRNRTPWSLAFKRELPPGKYVAYSSATNKAGVSELTFSKQLGNRETFKVKR